MWSKQFWKDVLDRCLRTAAQVIGYVLLTGEIGPGNEFDVNWLTVGKAGLYGVAAGLVLSLGAQWIGTRGTASFVPEVRYQPKEPVSL